MRTAVEVPKDNWNQSQDSIPTTYDVEQSAAAFGFVSIVCLIGVYWNLHPYLQQRMGWASELTEQ